MRSTHRTKGGASSSKVEQPDPLEQAILHRLLSVGHSSAKRVAAKLADLHKEVAEYRLEQSFYRRRDIRKNEEIERALIRLDGAGKEIVELFREAQQKGDKSKHSRNSGRRKWPNNKKFTNHPWGDPERH